MLLYGGVTALLEVGLSDLGYILVKLVRLPVVLLIWCTLNNAYVASIPDVTCRGCNLDDPLSKYSGETKRLILRL